MRLQLMIAMILLVGSTPVLCADWPQFRGPTGQGLVESGDLPLTWGPEKNVTWKQAIPGLGWSSPVIVGDRVYLTTAVPAGRASSSEQSLRALCLDAKTGKIVWNQEVFKQSASAPRIHTKNSHASPTPVCDGERLYVHFGHQGTACLDLNGKVQWRQTTLKYNPVHGNGGSPLLVDDLLIINCDGGDKQLVVALETKTGKIRWRADRKVRVEKGFSFCTPILIEVAGQQQVVSPGPGAVCAYDPKSGKEIWRVRYDGYSVVPRPVFGHGLVFLSTGYEDPNIIAIRPDGKGDVTDSHVAWTHRRGAPLNPSPLLVGDELYFISDNGVASCLDAKSGTSHWQQRLGGNFSASPVHANGRIYFQDEEGNGTVIKAGTAYERLARNAMDERTLASYAAADGALFLRTEKHLYRIEEKGSKSE